MKHRVGSTVKWQWGQGTAEGKVKESFDHEIEKTIKGSKIKRKGSKEDPAYLIEQEDGSKILKLHHELN